MGPDKPKNTQEKLSYRQQSVPFKGEVYLKYSVSPGSSFVAVVSAEGPRVESLFILPSGSRGARYSQVYRLPSLEPVGDALKLPGSPQQGGWVSHSCWSPSGRLLLYFDSSHARFLALPIDA